MNPQATPMLQSVALGGIFVAIAAVTDTLYALMASTVAPILKNARRVSSLGRYLTGGALIGLGLLTALAGSNKSADVR
ncbi:MAG TPA: hypothetical protein VET48_02955, partial [Steroidobacteraceae bacterium]|nr:hypothetical protein [Steroidobacteraceae bacterium]